MKRDDQDYYYERAEVELRLAQSSDLPQVVKAHYIIATHYIELAYASVKKQDKKIS